PQQSPSATFLACPALFFFLSFSLFFSLFLSLSQSNLTHEGQTGHPPTRSGGVFLPLPLVA
ncbi:hypothetical protein, partial [Providencia stuartii]|uniref:hypothetical protein n=1 Tax=Providencia stuartii TaxID=588 RepID=UPI003330B9B6